MKKLLFPVILPMLFIATTFSSCGIGEETNIAELVVKDFYKNLEEKDYDKAMSLIDDESLIISTKEEWMAVFTKKESFGKFIRFTKDMGFNINTSNGVTTVKLNYTCDYEKFTLYERFTMVKRGETYKIMSYEYNPDKNKLSD